MTKVKTVGSLKDFMTGQHRFHAEIKKANRKLKTHGIKIALTGIAGGLAFNLTHVGASNLAYAAGPAEYVKSKAKEQIVDAFMPLVDLVQALAYPIAAVMLSGGALLFMINQKDKAISLIQNASIGYILVQLMPLFLKILVGLGTSVGIIF
ncbi:hypothetical protein MHI39_20310 [Heyndrickxia sp. FSL K6-6286]|uniref:hypothetical protein n=1 Tax=Heyndrickxia sp. FSL K6-6286 TaxID=2921510 RepID=UPI00315AD689